MLIAIALVVAVLASYFTTPWFGVPFALLLFITLRALQFLALLYSREDVGSYELDFGHFRPSRPVDPASVPSPAGK
jgi:hypothetical protein